MLCNVCAFFICKAENFLTCFHSKLTTTTLLYTVADTRWSDWQMWSQCSNSCGSGTRKRLRVCEYSSSANIGHSCLGSELEYGPCFVRHCPGKLLDRLLHLLGCLIYFGAVIFTVRLQMHTHGLAIDICPSVCLSVRRVDCDKRNNRLSIFQHHTAQRCF